MRATFFSILENLYQDDKDIIILTADLGYKLFDNFQIISPERFYDVGIAEANMIGIASGLSLSGKNVYCYSIIPFLVMRAFEQIRVDIAYHNLNVKLIGVGGGFSYGLEGFTHFGLEDLALMRTLPNMSIVAPADPLEATCLANISYKHEGPMYIRLGKTGEPAVYDKIPNFQFGKAHIIKEGKTIAMFAIGNMVYIGKQVADLLAKKGLNLTLVNMHTLKPLDIETILQIASAHEILFSLEEHYVNGGLGSAIAEVLVENRCKCHFKRLGIPEKLGNYIGNADHLRHIYGLTPEKICEKILSEIKYLYHENYKV
ncbi:MAG: Transketolase, C-terminal section [Candidatus Jettenia ecosi]|uniref:Transketolase, C-terminal section n=1 Tax=Candidatus Jettenia ecosi TaxID=2494326 RepID=A0A533Q9M8_9BACT|nr:MAG: Transketolase, C-terminal section [Candidatus Jettenia ecosi]